MRIFGLFALIISTYAHAQNLDIGSKTYSKPTEKRVLFNPLASTTARTLPKWKFGFQRSGGANINSDVLNNALSVGVMDRLEIGTVPVFYISSPGSFNFMAKVNFYKGENVDWSASYAESRFEGTVERDGQIVERPNLILRSVNLGLNARPADLPNVTISPFINTVCGYLDSANSTTYARSLECKTEWGVDWQYQHTPNQWVTVAYGQLRRSGTSAYEELHSGFGVAWSVLRENKLFSRPSAGVFYTPDTNHALILISTTFYEK